MVVVRDRFDQSEKLVTRFGGDMVPDEAHPRERRFLHIGEFSFGNDGRMDLAEQINVFLHAPVHPLRLVSEDL